MTGVSMSEMVRAVRCRGR